MGSDENKIVLLNKAVTEHIQLPQEFSAKIEADVLRLDQVHPVISGNKWFKLKYYLQEATRENHDTLLTWGGAYSNHIIATACAAKQSGFHAIGIIRGERSTQLSHTLLAAEAYGMKLHFVSRKLYAEKKLSATGDWDDLFPKRYYEIPEGGAGEPGIRGSRDISLFTDYPSYSHIMCATGTGTMCTGLVDVSRPGQQVIAIHVLKGNRDIISGYAGSLSPAAASGRLQEMKSYHFGGYARKNDALFSFMNRWFKRTGIPSDFVYTGKLFYAFEDLLQKNYFLPGSRVLLIHSGGLQGNLSLPAGTLLF